MAKPYEPQTLQDAILHFADYQHCHNAVVQVRWPDGVVRCPRCGSDKVTYLANARVWKCYEKHPRAKFSLKVGTIFEDSPLPLQKWLPALWLLTNCKNGISSYELARALGVTQKTAWFMLGRLRLALQSEGGGKLGGHVEADETYIGGKARNMHYGKRKEIQRGRGPSKIAVMGMLERNSPERSSRVVTKVVASVGRRTIQQHLRASVEMDGKTVLYTDAFKSYPPKVPKGWQPSNLYIHKVIDHAEKYVDGEVHTNGMENFWSLLKRTIKGTYVSIEPFHLFRYLDEQAFRFNERKDDDGGRFQKAVKGIVNRRLTYATLTAAEAQR